MKSYVITLTSQQTLGTPELLNHYIFVDPIEGVNFTYPLTTNGGVFTPYSFTEYVSGGLFFPWGYTFQTTYRYLSSGYLKGPHTIMFSPTALDTRFYGVLKIAYDFGDGEVYVQERDVVPNNVDAGISTLDPSQIVISHDYWPKNNTVTTYYPSISVLNGNLALDVYFIDIKIFPASVYDLGSFKLINTTQHAESLLETAAVFEVQKPSRFVTNARIFSGGPVTYNEEKLTIDFDDPDLILNLDASDPFMMIKNSLNKVVRWKDKTQYNNDFTQSNKNFRPDFIYEAQSEANRKGVWFNTAGYSLTCINETAFSSITGGYTMFFVMKANSPQGTILSLTDTALPGMTNTQISHILVYKRALSIEEAHEIKHKLRYKWGLL